MNNRPFGIEKPVGRIGTNGGSPGFRRSRSGGGSRDCQVRAILPASMTTFFGLLPILMEKASQARYLIPMAVSLAFGILFSAVITLVLVPSI